MPVPVPRREAIIPLEPPIGSYDHLQGALEAEYSLVEYGDFECPYCRAAAPVIDEVRARLGDRLVFAFRHFPEETLGLYTLAGHVHPGVVMRGPGRQRLKLPCFTFGPRVGVLPAFGGFTGTAAGAPRSGDRVFAVADGEVLEVS